ncbi:MAG: class D sortase [Anaerolineae bacterium]|nr:class D sortase [Anaerolineae bacterium]
MGDRRYVDELTIEELEEILLIRRREERLARLRRIGIATAPDESVIVHQEGTAAIQTVVRVPKSERRAQVFKTKSPSSWRDRLLLGVEVVALVGLIAIVISLAFSVRNLNQEWNEGQAAQALPTPTATPLIRAAVLPGGHMPPTVAGGETQPLNPVPAMVIPTPGPQSPTRLVIPSINVDVPVVEGDDWEQLKKGAGHHVGSANPGERGNVFISGHNDVYGEIFRYLENVKVGDPVIVYAGQQPYTYVVRATRIVDPKDVSIMYPTSSPIVSLMTCYPYMVDSHRLVVIAELEQ